MSILIKGVKMPTNCMGCPYEIYTNCIIYQALSARDYSDCRHPDCPLVEVLPHGRLIDADYMKRHLMFSQGINDCGALYAPYDEIKKEIDRMPTVIESEEPDHE